MLIIFSFHSVKKHSRPKKQKMSGGVGSPCGNVDLPKEVAYKEQDVATSVHSNEKTSVPPKAAAGFLSFRQLNALVAIIVFSASGLVSPEDMAFVMFSFIYMYFLSRVAFPDRNPSIGHAVFDPQSKIFRLYFYLTAIVGLLLPIAYICEGILEGDKEGIKAAVPHVFLLCGQVLMEGLAYSDKFSIPIGVFVPVFYNSRRIFTLVDWLRNELSKEESDHGGPTWRLFVGRALAGANMALWCYNLFGFLLPVYLPRAFKKYYSGFKVKDEKEKST